MPALITDLVQQCLTVATDSEARLLLVDASAGGHNVVSLHGTLDGPNCLHARTLPTVFRLHARRDPESGAASAEVLVTDPCYWTPALPFLYTLIVELQMADGTEMTVSHPLALRRWCADGPNLRLERKRVVLRGAEMRRPEAGVLPTAHGVETALLVRQPDLAFCREANRQGVAIIADFRSMSGDALSALRACAWQPSVMMALVDDAAGEKLGRLAAPLLAAVVRRTDNDTAAVDRPWADVIAVEVAVDERPPAWLATCGKPVVAIRRGATYAAVYGARAACDRLQGDLAPEFNLAGYFVAPD
jgi:hypothetical protein